MKHLFSEAKACFLFFMFFSVASNLFAQKLLVEDLTVEHQTNPLSIDNPKPRFSWKITSDIKNTKQTGYEIRLSNQAEFSKKPFWKAERRDNQSVLVSYEGPELTSKTKYFWQVRVKDNHGNTSSWSPVQYFQTGLKPEDWSASWITVAGKDSISASPLFRKDINLKKKYSFSNGLYYSQRLV